MKAIHSLWTEPLFSEKPYFMQDFEIFTIVLSALTWKKYNGAIKIVADKKALNYLESLGLLSIYDEVQELLVSEKINSKTFWAAEKLFALQQQSDTVAVIDNDFIAWRNIDELLNGEITVTHRENLNNLVYIDAEYFRMDDKYIFNSGWDWKTLPCNTAFLCIKDNVFRNYYISEAINFMRHCVEENNDVRSMVFAEQRLLSICASQWNIMINTLIDETNLDSQKTFTHIWGYKDILRKNDIKRKEFCIRCSLRIKNDFSEIIPVLSRISPLEEYFL